MKSEFRDYLRAIDMPEVFVRKLEDLFLQVEFLSSEEITELFVEDYLQEDGTREFGGAFFFSNRYVLEADQFQTSGNLEIAPLNQNVYHIILKSENYDYASRQATDRSRMYCRVALKYGMQFGFELKASKENCEYLARLITNVIRPHLAV